ncbi:glycosyltransferase family 2 protein [Acidisphaera sp. L21]|uniref:glycosyltransferase n=1 Tax=Acidisphaera sp. L21 TaxID=1641851 RepID=UPI00131CCEA8|nr:glycosyltransferase family 2 protein [Acidisphaera sp. L21]
MQDKAALGPVVVAIPAKDEVERIAACLDALNAQIGARVDHIVLLVNNSTDATAAIARAFIPDPQTRVHVIERDFPPGEANAGHARSLAMDLAAELAGPDGVLMTTDADGVVDPDWVAAALDELRAGADVVAGWVDLHPIEWGQIPIALHEDDARECAYDALSDEIHARLDVDPADPMPRHTQHSGASIAVTAAAFARCGGVPLVPSGEDRALIAALRRVDARVRHSPAVHVSVSGRITGRSPGGMADTIQRRMGKPDPFLDDRLEPATDCVRRALCRAELRQAYLDPARDRSALAARLDLPAMELTAMLHTRHFGQAWDRVEAASPALRRNLVPVWDLPTQMLVAESILRPSPGGLADPAGNLSLESEGLA